MKRRPFLKLSGGIAAGSMLGLDPTILLDKAWSANITKKVNGVPYRLLGRTGLEVSIVGYPGLAMNKEEQAVCNRSAKEAIEKGINYFDVAPAYGSSEEKMGQAIKEIGRDQFYLACKTKKRDKEGAREELERSLKRLHTDHFDVYQMHHLRTTDEVKQAFGPNGCMETFFEAQKEGKVRYLGFSAHTTKSALLAMENYKFDTVMFPINFVEFYTFGFGKDVMELAEKQGAAVLAIKPMCGGYWPEGVEKTRDWWYMPLEEQDTINKALSFALSQKNVTVGFPPAFVDLFSKAVEAVKAYHFPKDEEIESLKTLASNSLSVFKERQKKYSMLSPEEEGMMPCPYSLG